MATNPLPQIGWDSCVILDFLDQRPDRYPFILPIAKDAFDKKIVIVVSMLAIAETLHLSTAPPDQEKTISDFFDSPFVHREAPSQFICELARDIRRAHPVDGADSIHLATAAFTNTPFFLTTDGTARKKKKPLLPLDWKIELMNGQRLRIMSPKDYDDFQRFQANPILENIIGHLDAAPQSGTKNDAPATLQLPDLSGASAEHHPTSEGE